MSFWKKTNNDEIKSRVFKALKSNVDFRNESALGVPASHLDSNVFYIDAPFLKDAPFLSSMVNNPNHIGCHTLGDSEPYFKGTHELEKEVIKICAEDILAGGTDLQDGYIASGGTEANIQAYWIYRNYFLKEFKSSINEIAFVCSKDSHYSVYKGANLLGIELYSVPVDENERKISQEDFSTILKKALSEGKKYFIIQANMATTMFGSVDDINIIVDTALELGIEFKIHVDGAFGGFIYPFTTSYNKLTFKNPYISSFTLDAHKMLQAPYGTGVFLCKKNLMQYVNTDEAQYVNGMDITLSGSRSGANAIAVWMILMTYGSFGWQEKIFTLVQRTDWLCKKLDLMKIKFFRYDNMNIVTIKSEFIPMELAKKYGLVPESHNGENKWWKIVVMDHVTMEKLSNFIKDIEHYQPIIA